jgi:hypothetical protein
MKVSTYMGYKLRIRKTKKDKRSIINNLVEDFILIHGFLALIYKRMHGFID